MDTPAENDAVEYTDAPSRRAAAQPAADALGDDNEEAFALGAELAVDAADAVPAELRIGAAEAGSRLDRVLAARLPRVSRTRIQAWIAAGAVHRNGLAVRARDAVCSGDRIALAPPPDPALGAQQPEPMALAVVYEDETILVLDKPAGLVVHPAAGHWSGTLLNGLLAYDPRLARLPRAGLVHRLDADTTGLMVVARTLAAQFDLVGQLQARSVLREYWAIVYGAAPASLTIDAALARDPRRPLRFKTSRSAAARPARTHVRLVRRQRTGAEGGAAGGFSWVACRLDTGRTHQIRVHLEAAGYPLVGDPVYRDQRPAVGSVLGREAALAFPRQALHAARLGLRHPQTGDWLQWFRAPPRDLRRLMRALGFRLGGHTPAPFDVPTGSTGAVAPMAALGRQRRRGAP